MTTLSKLRRGLLVLPLALMVGCGGGDGPTGPVNVLSAEDALDAFDALTAITGLTEVPVGPVGPALRSEIGRATFPMPSLTVNVDNSDACPISGTSRVRGSFTFNEATGAISADLRETYANCRAASSSGREWTFNGSPNVRTVLTFSGDDEVFGGSGSVTGGFRYSSNGETGTCTIALTMTFTELSGSITGSVCGQPVSEQFDSVP